MNMKLTLATLLLLAAGTTQAASLRLVPSVDLVDSVYKVVEGATFTVDLVLDAPDPLRDLVSGAITVDFDRTLLGYGGFTLASPLTFFWPESTATDGDTQTVTFGFENAPKAVTVGTFSFTALGTPGSVARIGLADQDDVFGSFAYKMPSDQRLYPEFLGTEVTIAAVPLPASVWLLGTAVGALVARRRFRHVAD